MEGVLELGFARTGKKCGAEQEREQYFQWQEIEGRGMLQFPGLAAGLGEDKSFFKQQEANLLLLGRKKSDLPEGVFFRNGQKAVPLLPRNDGEDEKRNLAMRWFRLQNGDSLVLLIQNHGGAAKVSRYAAKLPERLSEAAPCLAAWRIADWIQNESECNGDGSVAEGMGVLVVGMRPVISAVLFIGPPANPQEDTAAIRHFFSLEGIHIICGGTTAVLFSRYLDRPIEPWLETGTDEIPAMGHLEGVDIVTEGVITLKELAVLLNCCKEDSRRAEALSERKDAAALLARLFLSRANQITILFGCAGNPAHEGSEISFRKKREAVFQLTDILREMGKQVWIQMY